MSDRVYDVSEAFRRNVWPEYSRSVGLFPIPEYPEDENKGNNGMWSTAFQLILTTLRYLSPATLFSLLWGEHSLLFRILRRVDVTFKSIVYSSDAQRDSVLKWLEEAGPARVEHLDTVWRHGWILCGVLDAAMPGACAGHPPTRLTLEHAQSIADNYLGVEQVFSRQELESNDSLSKHLEWKLAQYLDRIRQAIGKMSPAVSRPISQRTSPERPELTLDYVARGAGLTAAQINNKMYFKIFPTAQQCLDPGEITVIIKGPQDTYGMLVVPPLLGKAQLIRQKLLGLRAKTTYTENVLPLAHGVAYLRAYGKNNMNKTFHIPKTKCDIEINVEARVDHVQVGYIVPIEGKYELSIATRGSHIVGSPFTIAASQNILEVLQKDSFCLEDGEEIDIVDVKSDKKVVLRIVDFVTEKMLLKENGTFERISDEEANILMSLDNSEGIHKIMPLCDEVYTTINTDAKISKFKNVSIKIKTMIKICNMFKKVLHEKRFSQKYIHKDIPDVVNSTFHENNISKTKEKVPQVIIPDNMTLLLQTERVKTVLCDANDYVELSIKQEYTLDLNCSPNPFQDKLINYDKNSDVDKDNSLITDNSQLFNEIEDIPIKIVIEKYSESPNTNPFVDSDILNLERPKTPILKIITGQHDRLDSPFINSNQNFDEDEIRRSNEFLNPFFVHNHDGTLTTRNEDCVDYLTTDFIIGAPVSLPPLIKAHSPEPDMDSIIFASNLDEALYKYEIKIQSKQKEHVDGETCTSEFLTPVHNDENNSHTPADVIVTQTHTVINSTFHSTDSSINEKSEDVLNTQSNSFGEYSIENMECTKGDNNIPKKDMWDSAYVSIDDNNGSPEGNIDNSTINEISNKYKMSLSDGIKNEVFLNMGPAEREIWQTCHELTNEVPPKINEEQKTCKWDFKRPIFTPIIEESDRSLSTGLKETTGLDRSIQERDEDLVNSAFTELNDIFQEYYPDSELNSLPTSMELNQNMSKGVEYITEQNVVRVESASEIETDVMRQRIKKLEGKISEVQITESSSVSRALKGENSERSQVTNKNNNYKPFSGKSKERTQFGEECQENLVLERKKYWDEKIRLLEEIKSQQQYKKKKLSSKHLRHNDSLTKRRGKQIVKNFLKAGESNAAKINKEPSQEVNNNQDKCLFDQQEQLTSNIKLVEKWKKYWDEKLVSESEKQEISNVKIQEPNYERKEPQYTEIEHITQNNNIHVTHHIQCETYSKTLESSDNINTSLEKPVKEEIAEEVFKAFENSPKRFFGTSRKHIMNKIDVFLGNENTISNSVSNIKYEHSGNGIVSSRISLFHDINQTQELENLLINNKHSKIIAPSRECNEDNTLSNESYGEQSNLQNQSSIQSEHKLNSLIVQTTTQKKNEDPLPVNKTAPTIQSYRKGYEYDKISRNEKTITATNKEKRKLSGSKSEMDIFSKINNTNGNDDESKYKSCEELQELPKVNVKGFITLYETVTKNASLEHVHISSKKLKSTLSFGDSIQPEFNNIDLKSETIENTTITKKLTPYNIHANEGENNNLNSLSSNTKKQEFIKSTSDKLENDNYLHLKSIVCDMDVEIINMTSTAEINHQPPPPPFKDEATPEREISTIDYKSRFKLAQAYFKSLQNLQSTEKKKHDKLNECELILHNNQVTDTPKDNDTTKSRPNKLKVKSNSLPSSDFSNVWSQFRKNKKDCVENREKFIKISEKFNVEDLFNDVVGEGRLSRQGSFKGIPNKKAVLETFKSMENVSINKLSSYEIAMTQLTDFAKENNIKNVQTYSTEYPYLPTTDPSKYHSRCDARTSGLISRSELLNNKPRRNSVPDLRMNTKFIENL